jgi:methionyl-tRNA synthetase
VAGRGAEVRVSRRDADELASDQGGRAADEPASGRAGEHAAGGRGGWGIPVPGDPDQVVYVWWDALANYVTALGYGTGDPAYRTWWCGSAERVHVIGKGIVRFHAVHWLALLLSAGEPLPTTIFVHDYLTVDGAKLSKSSGNAVDPVPLSERYGVDALRWWLVRDVAPTGDTDFTAARLVRRADQDLANGLGNLVNRTLSLAHRHRGGEITGRPADLVAGLPDRIDRALAAFDLRAAAVALCEAVDAGNRYLEAERPWEHLGRLDDVLATVVHAARVITRELEPFLPEGAGRLRAQLGTGRIVGTPSPAFPRLAVRS